MSDIEIVTLDDIILFLSGYATPRGMVSTYRDSLAADLYEWIESGFDSEYLR